LCQIIKVLVNKNAPFKDAFLFFEADLTTAASWIYFADLLEVSKVLELDN
tara:strand:- start:1620 stop:1769 length:150 start_codon:yes stop_codon:yes gene_type:complete